MLTCSLSKAKIVVVAYLIVVVAYLIHITGVYPQNFEWPGCACAWDHHAHFIL